VWELVQAGGWLMLPIILCSVLATGIVVERFWSLQRKRVHPENLLAAILTLVEKQALTPKTLNEIASGSPLGLILATGLANRAHSRERIKESIEEVGGHVAHDLERFMNSLGTIAVVTPLLGLLGTVIGMIQVFTAITVVGIGDPGQLAGGISEALLTTAAGLCVAIPSLIFHRHLKRRIDDLVVGMEQEALRLLDSLHGKGVA